METNGAGIGKRAAANLRKHPSAGNNLPPLSQNKLTGLEFEPRAQGTGRLVLRLLCSYTTSSTYCKRSEGWKVEYSRKKLLELRGNGRRVVTNRNSGFPCALEPRLLLLSYPLQPCQCVAQNPNATNPLPSFQKHGLIVTPASQRAIGLESNRGCGGIGLAWLVLTDNAPCWELSGDD